MKMYMRLLFLGFCAAMIISSCDKLPSTTPEAEKIPKLSDQTEDYIGIKIPQHFGSNAENIFFKGSIGFGASNPEAGQFNPIVKNEGARLGRVLFYDKKLSISNTISCGSCHIQSSGFSDVTALSQGFKGLHTSRNSSSIGNAALSASLFWDGRNSTVKSMTLNPVQNHIEMGMEDLNFLVKKLSSTSYYPDLFKKAFGNSEITKERIANALAQFVCSMVSVDSKYDKESAVSFRGFSELEKKGKDLFFSSKTNCTACHGGPNFSVNSVNSFNDYTSSNGTANIGLDIQYKDQGFGNGKFKIPSLRNVELTAPYMHDGRFKTLEEVVEHYNSGIANHPQLDRNLKINGQPRRLNLNEQDKKALVAFLKTLTDETLVKDVKFSDPFQQ